MHNEAVSQEIRHNEAVPQENRQNEAVSKESRDTMKSAYAQVKTAKNRR